MIFLAPTARVLSFEITHTLPVSFTEHSCKKWMNDQLHRIHFLKRMVRSQFETFKDKLYIRSSLIPFPQI